MSSFLAEASSASCLLRSAALAAVLAASWLVAVSCTWVVFSTWELQGMNTCPCSSPLKCEGVGAPLKWFNSLSASPATGRDVNCSASGVSTVTTGSHFLLGVCTSFRTTLTSCCLSSRSSLATSTCQCVPPLKCEGTGASVQTGNGLGANQRHIHHILGGPAVGSDLGTLVVWFLPWTCGGCLSRFGCTVVTVVGIGLTWPISGACRGHKSCVA